MFKELLKTMVEAMIKEKLLLILALELHQRANLISNERGVEHGADFITDLLYRHSICVELMNFDDNDPILELTEVLQEIDSSEYYQKTLAYNRSRLKAEGIVFINTS